jgi:Cft2 family RNA processing exonuclease
MLSFATGVHVRGTPVHMDSRRPRPRAIVSHAHSDHVASHACWVTTPATARIAARRFGAAHVETHAFGEPWQEGEARVTLLPAGHILGSAMVLVEYRGQRILYTGDFRTGPSLTAEPCTPVPADVLVMECTFGAPLYRFPPREHVTEQIEGFVRRCFGRDEVPVLLAYSLGKAQEAARLLGDRGIRVALHFTAYEMLEVYQELGVPFRNSERFDRGPLEETALILPPYLGGSRLLDRYARRRTAYLSGWALQPGVRRNFQVDEAFALSDHCDFDELLAFVGQVAPRQIYTLHGPDEFSQHLRARGHRAEPGRVGAQLFLL